MIFLFIYFELLKENVLKNNKRAFTSKNCPGKSAVRVPCLGSQHCVHLAYSRCLTDGKAWFTNAGTSVRHSQMLSITHSRSGLPKRKKPVMHMNGLDIHNSECYQMKPKWRSNTVFLCCYVRQPRKRLGRGGQKTLWPSWGILRHPEKKQPWGVLHSLSLKPHLPFMGALPLYTCSSVLLHETHNYCSVSLFFPWLGSSLKLGTVLVLFTSRA